MAEAEEDDDYQQGVRSPGYLDYRRKQVGAKIDLMAGGLILISAAGTGVGAKKTRKLDPGQLKPFAQRVGLACRWRRL